MNTADSIVTVMNILQTIECFSPSSITIEIRFCLFRTWSFTLFTNDLDSTDNSNSVSSFPMTNCCGHCFSLRINIGSPGNSRGTTSFITDCAVPSCWVSSWEKPVGILLSLPKKLHRVSRSFVAHLQYQFSTLEKTMHGHHTTLSNLLWRNFP